MKAPLFPICKKQKARHQRSSRPWAVCLYVCLDVCLDAPGRSNWAPRRWSQVVRCESLRTRCPSPANAERQGLRRAVPPALRRREGIGRVPRVIGQSSAARCGPGSPLSRLDQRRGRLPAWRGLAQEHPAGDQEEQRMMEARGHRRGGRRNCNEVTPEDPPRAHHT